MSGISNPPSALVISKDQELIDLLKTSNTTEQTFEARESIQIALEDRDLLAGNGIVIIDLAVNDNDVSTTISQLVRLKRHDPSQVLIVVGDRVPLGEILKSNIQPIVYRAFNKPIHPKQIFLAFDHAYELHDEQVALMAAGGSAGATATSVSKAELEAISADKQKSPLLYLAIGLTAAAILGCFLYNSEKEVDPAISETPVLEAPVTEDSAAIEGTVSIEDGQPSVADEIEQSIDAPAPPVEEELDAVKALNLKAAEAFANARFVSPAGDNALEYYQQALTLDPYDSVAYQGKKSIAGAIRQNYQQFVNTTQFDKALASIRTLQDIEPLNEQNDKLHGKLEQSIEAYASKIQSSGSAEEIERATTILNKVEKSFGGSNSAAAALLKEQGLIKQIDTAINADNLVPPGKNNAYSLVSSSLRNNAISKANSEPRVAMLGKKLLTRANKSLDSSDLPDAEKLAALVRKLNGKSPELSKLNQAINERKKAEIEAQKKLSNETLAIANQQGSAQQEVEEPAKPVIIPAVVIDRPSPRYPRVALNRNISGWVDLSFTINVKGATENVTVVASEPSGIFNEVAIRAVKRWKFQPASIESTGEVVESSVAKTRLNFQLED